MKKSTLVAVIALLLIAGFIGGGFAYLNAKSLTLADVFQKTSAVTETTPVQKLKAEIDKIPSAQPSAEEYDRLMKIKDDYEALSDGEKAEVGEIVGLDDALKKSAPAKREAVLGEIASFTGAQDETGEGEIRSLIENNYSVLEKEDIEKYLSYAVHGEALKSAEKLTKEKMRVPDSYKRSKYLLRDYAYIMSDGTYEISVSIDYTGKRPNGTKYSANRLIYCYYKVTKNGVKLKKTVLSSYDIWKLAHGHIYE